MRVLALVAVLVLPAVAAQTPTTWDELAGGSARTGAAFLPTATLDVLASRDLFGDDTEIRLAYSKGLVDTPRGLVALADRDDVCVLLHITPDSVEETRLDPCDSATLTAYDRANDRLLLCSVGDGAEPILQSRDATTGALVWSVRPDDVVTNPSPFAWTCAGTALARAGGALYTAFWSGGSVGNEQSVAAAAVVRVATADGAVEWVRPLTAAEFYGGGVGARVERVVFGGFLPYGISETESGLVISGRASCACGKGEPTRLANGVQTQQGAVAWLNADNGAIVGAALAEEDAGAFAEGVPTRFFGQWWATTRGPLATFTLGERVLLVNPAERTPIREAPWEGVESGRGFIGIVPSAWWGDVVVAPLASSVTGLDAETLAPRWSWTPGREWRVSALVVLPPSDVLVAATYTANGTESGQPTVVHRVDLERGIELQRLPLPGLFLESGGRGRLQFHPLPSGELLVYSQDGRLVTLGPVDPAARPRLSVTDAFPAPTASVDVSVEAPDPAARYAVAWGDGTVVAGGQSWAHRYGTAGTYVARVTALHPDGRTATSETVLRVGETPPPALNAIQRAFSPERQDLTFGLLGLALTLGGAGVAVLVRRRRRGRLHEELSALEAIRAQGRQDPEGAVRALGALRERLLADVGAHKLDDGQYNTIEARANVVFAALRARLLGPVQGRLTADFRHALDVVLHDGRVDAEELAQLRAALDAERHVSAEERARLLALLERLGP